MRATLNAMLRTLIACFAIHAIALAQSLLFAVILGPGPAPHAAAGATLPITLDARLGQAA